jgi:hypothetical protein
MGRIGWTGHHDHRLVSTVVTEVFQTQKWNKPVQLFYSAIPPATFRQTAPMQLATVDSSFLPVKIAVSESDYETSIGFVALLYKVNTHPKPLKVCTNF